MSLRGGEVLLQRMDNSARPVMLQKLIEKKFEELVGVVYGLGIFLVPSLDGNSKALLFKAIFNLEIRVRCV